MCKYDDMYVQLLPLTTNKILKKRGPETLSHTCVSSYCRTILKNIIDTTRIWLLIYLLISPVSGGPLIRPVKNPRSTPITVPFRHNRGHPKVGIGIVDSAEGVPQLSVDGSESAVQFQKVSIPLNSYLSSSSLQGLEELHSLESQSDNSLQGLIASSPKETFHSSEQIYKKVPKLSGSSHTESDHHKRIVPTQNSFDTKRSRSQKVRHSKSSTFHISSMDEMDNSNVGRERRATAATPSGGGHWMKPCPNLDSKVDETATPASLSTLILRAIQEAKSQVDKFINDFAREAFQVDSWQDSLAEHSDFSLAFLNNSSGIDLSSSPEISFAEALQEAYELMQRRAVGIEQVTLDQALYQASFLTEFRHVEDRIVHVLCELRYAMIQSTVTPKEDVTKDVMEETTRDMDGERRRNIRDAVILREYVTGLQTLHKLFNQFSTENH